MKAQYEYKTVTVTKENEHGDITVEAEANFWAEQGWRTVSVITKTGFLTGINQLLLERAKPTDYVPGEEGFEAWRAKQRDPQS